MGEVELVFDLRGFDVLVCGFCQFCCLFFVGFALHRVYPVKFLLF